MFVSKFVYTDIDSVVSAERKLLAAVEEIESSTQECIFINVLRAPQKMLIVQSETEATGRKVRRILNAF